MLDPRFSWLGRKFTQVSGHHATRGNVSQSGRALPAPKSARIFNLVLFRVACNPDDHGLKLGKTMTVQFCLQYLRASHTGAKQCFCSDAVAETVFQWEQDEILVIHEVPITLGTSVLPPYLLLLRLYLLVDGSGQLLHLIFGHIWLVLARRKRSRYVLKLLRRGGRVDW